MKRSALPVLALLFFTLVGCGTGSAVVSGAPSATASTTTPSVTKNSTYTDAAGLKDAAVLAGYTCPSWTATEDPVDASSRGSCSDRDVFSVFPTDTATDRNIEGLKSLGTDMIWLVGPKWSIAVDTSQRGLLEGIQPALGGVIVES